MLCFAGLLPFFSISVGDRVNPTKIVSNLSGTSANELKTKLKWKQADLCREALFRPDPSFVDAKPGQKRCSFALCSRSKKEEAKREKGKERRVTSMRTYGGDEIFQGSCSSPSDIDQFSPTLPETF
jgi:hypothetical protein